MSVAQTGESLTLATLISERCRDLELSKPEFVSRVGCRNIQKGIRRLHELFDGDCARTKALIEAISAALDVRDDVVSHAAQVSQQLLDSRTRRQLEIECIPWNSNFEPHAIILTERTGPELVFAAAPIGIEGFFRIDFAGATRPIAFIKLAMNGMRQKLARWHCEALPIFGRPTGILVNYTPESSIRFDLDGTPREVFKRRTASGEKQAL